MPTETLSIGPVHAMVEDTVYAMPPKICYIHSNVALEVSNTSDFAAVQAVSANTPTLGAGAFVRSTTAAAVVRLVGM